MLNHFIKSSTVAYKRVAYKKNLEYCPTFEKADSSIISGQFFFVPMVSAIKRENFSIFSSLISCGTHVWAWHIGWDLILFLLLYFLLKMVLVMNELRCHKKSSPISQRLSNDFHNNFTRAPVRKCFTELLVNCLRTDLFSKVFLKISQILLENTYAR